MPGARDRAASPRLSIEAAGLKISRHAMPLRMQLFAQGRILRSLGAQTLHEVDRLNLMLVI